MALTVFQMTNSPLFRWVLPFLLLWLAQPAFCNDAILIDDYRDGLKPQWQEKSFSGNTEYRVVRPNDRPAIQAVSRESASALMYEIEYDVVRYPILSWRWKIEKTIPGGDARHKETDDFAARVYIVFPSWAFWKTTALNYVWANRLPRGEMIPNAYTDNAMMIAVESGEEKAGRWVEERVNVLQDSRRTFGTNPPQAGAVAIMTDTDNTGQQATAWYGPISILSKPAD